MSNGQKIPTKPAYATSVEGPFETSERVKKSNVRVNFVDGKEIDQKRIEDILLHGLTLVSDQILSVSVTTTVVSTTRKRRDI